jgi:SAM-dependent methyltransferase
MSMTHPASTERYLLGHSDAEIQRLILQARMLGPITERMLLRANVQRGMRILDVGCGAGDVASLAAELVGPEGEVVAIDRSPEAISTARSRGERAGIGNVRFEVSSVEDFEDRQGFDLVIGRYVLVHQIDAIAFLRAAANLVRNGGSFALHEVDMVRWPACRPAIPIFDKLVQEILTALARGVGSFDAAMHMASLFSQAGLRRPQLFSETPVDAGGDSPVCAWYYDLFRTLYPDCRSISFGDGDAVDIEGVLQRLRDEVQATNAQVEMPAQICAWTKVEHQS